MTRTALPPLLLTLVLGTAAGADDPVRAALEKARSAYDEEVGGAKKGVTTAIQAREDEARRRGDKKAVDAVKDEREGFAATGALPKSVPTRTYESRLRQARQALLAAYADAVKGYTRGRMDDAAALVEEEMARFAAGNPAGAADARTVWVAKGGRRFARVGGKKWTETAPDGAQAHYVEVDRNPDFVELRRTDGQGVRLHAAVFYWGGDSPDRRARVWKENLPADEGRGGWVK